MTYIVAHFSFSSCGEWQQDVFYQQLADIGFEAFDGSDAYIQSALYDPSLLDAVMLQNEDISLLSIEACPDENWNVTWEQEHPQQILPLGVIITPHCAFGAGHHETTSMLVDRLMAQPKLIKNATVLDMGCGTGVLGIFAAKLGASHVTFVDIDDKSVENTRENINHNCTEGQSPCANFTLLCQGTVPEGSYNLILANIHRNILSSQMADYARCLIPKGQLWISGFYASDCAFLTDTAVACGLHLVDQNHKGEWYMLCFEK